MAEEIVKVIKIETAGGQQTVKGLRDEIKSLRDDLLNLNKGTKEYDETLSKIVKDETELTQVMRAGKDEVAKSLKSVTNEYTSQRQELKALKVELEQLQPGSEAYNKAFQRAAEITHNLSEQQQMLKYASTDLGDQLSNMRGIAANMAAGFSAVNAAVGLFGGESEEAQQAMLKVQQAMALVQGLQGIDGFIKRTQGLSTAIKGWISQSKAATVQTTAQATATKAAATATNAETVATQGATVAQKGLNAAMKANPIGFIVGLLAILITNWKKITEWIGKAVGGFDKLNKAMDKFKAIASGVANVLKKVILVPIKELLNTVTTLGKVMGDIFTGNWKNIGKDLKDGINNSLEIIKDGYDVAASYAEGAEAQITKQKEKADKERAALRQKEIQDVINAKDAEIGADWKYTEDAKKLYDEMFDLRMAQYKKDSDEYKEAQNDKIRYDREFEEHKKKADDDAKKAAEDARKKAQEAAKKAQDELKKIETDYQKNIASTIGASYKETYINFRENVTSFVNYFKKAGKDLNNSELSIWIDTFTKNYTDDLDKVMTENELFKRETQALLNGLSQEEIESFTDYDNKEKFREAVKTLGMEGGMSLMEGVKIRMAAESTRLNKQATALLKDIIDSSSEEANKKINNEIIKLFQKTIKPQLDEELIKLQSDIEKEKIKLDFEIETGMDFDSFNKKDSEFIPIKNFDKKATEFERATSIYNNSLEQIRTQLNYYQQTVDYVEKNGLIPSEEYENAVKMVEQLTNQMQQLHIDYFNTNAEIRDRYFAKDIERLQALTDAELREETRKYNELYTKGSDYYNLRVTQAGLLPSKEMEFAEKTYQIQKEGIQKQIDAYNSYLEDTTVVGEQRVEAERMVAELTAQIEEGEVAHTIQMNEMRLQSYEKYFSFVQDGLNSIGSLFGGLADLYEADIKAKKDNNEMTQEEYEKAFENVKGIKIAEATMSMISGALGALMQGMSAYPPPFGEIIGGIGAAAALASGAAQIAQIKAQKPDGSGSESSSLVATPRVQSFTPEYVENPTGNSELSSLRNSYMNQNIYVRVSDIEAAQNGTEVRVSESSF